LLSSFIASSSATQVAIEEEAHCSPVFRYERVQEFGELDKTITLDRPRVARSEDDVEQDTLVWRGERPAG